MSNRPKFITRTIRLVGQMQRDALMSLIPNLPIYSEKPLEVVIREEVKARTPDANSRMWAGPLRDMAEQAFVNGRQYSAEVWHEHFKAEFLPEDDDQELHLLAKDPQTWKKWDYNPKCERVCVGSTTHLTPLGMARHCQQIEAFGASLGVLFHEAPRRMAA